MPGLTTHIVLLCIGTGFFIAVEGLNIMIKDASNADVEGNFHEINSREKSSHLEMIKWLNDDWLKENPRRLKQIKEKRTVNALVKELNTNENKNDNIETHKKKSLRLGDVKGFMQKLNSFIQQGMYKNYGVKRDDCNFGFRNPLSRKCKKVRGTSHLGLFKLVQHSAEDNKERRRHYKQHMVEERARYNSDSDDDDMLQHTAKDNKKRRRYYKQHMVDEPASSSDSDNDDMVQHTAKDNKERRRYYKQHMVDEPASSSDSDNDDMVQHTAKDNKERRKYYKQHMVDEPARYSSDSDNDDMVQHTAKDNKERRRYYKQHMVDEPASSSDSDNDDMVQHTAEDNKERRRRYKQHMVVERARYSSDSDNDDKRYSGKSRFKVVGNAKQKKKQTQQKVSSESEQSESEETNSDYEEPKNVYESSDSAERKPEETANDEDSEREKGSEEKASDSDRSSESSEEYMYLQGSRLVKSQALRSRSNNYGRDGSGLYKLPYSRRDHEDKRLPYFMPKRYDWDPSMIHDLDSFWNIGIKSKMHPYNRFWFF